MPLSEQEILRFLMQSRERISAATWVVVQDSHVAEDIFQNTVIKAVTREVQFKAEAALLSWAMISARREGLDWLRKHRRERVGIDEEILDLLAGDWDSGAIAPPEGKRIESLRTCVEQLPKNSRKLLQLRYDLGHNCSEIADQVNAKRDAIYQRLSRLHAGLRKCVETQMTHSTT